MRFPVLFLIVVNFVFSAYGFAQNQNMLLKCDSIPLQGIKSITVTRTANTDEYIASQSFDDGRIYSNKISTHSYSVGIIELAEPWNGYTLTLEKQTDATWNLTIEDECQKSSHVLYCSETR